MSAAIAKACIVCQASSSKYKCPKCSGPTCSLGCSTKHKTDTHPIETSTSAIDSDRNEIKNEVESFLPSLRQFSNPTENITAPPSHRFTNIDKYVPMNAYDEANMLEDFEYLQFMGQSIASLGRDLVKKGWYKPDQTNSNGGKDGGHHLDHRNQNQSGGNHKHNQSSNSKVSSEVRNRQQFESSIRRLRIPIMLLPDGMSSRKENQTRFKAQNQQLMCTIQISFPSGTSDDRRARRVIQHHVSWSDKKIGEIVKTEIVKRLRNKVNPGKKGEENYKTASETDEQISPWQAMIGKEGPQSSSLKDENAIKAFKDLKDFITIAVPVHCDKLRNETSAKFLEWWQRQVRNGMVLEGGLKFDEEKKMELERRRNGDWGPIEGLGEGELQEKEGSAVENLQDQSTSTSAEISGLISNDILSRLISQREAVLQRKKKEEEGAVKAVVSASNQKGGKGSTTDPSGPPVTPTTSTIRHLIVLQGDETIESLLRRIEKGYGIVEYPHFEVWQKNRLSEWFGTGKAKKVELHASETTEELEEIDDTDQLRSPLETTQESPSHPVGKRALEDFNDSAAKKVRIDTGSQANNQQSSALVGLSAYDSSDEDVDDDEVAGGEEDETADAQSKLESEMLDHVSSQVANMEKSTSLVDIAREMGMVHDE